MNINKLTQKQLDLLNQQQEFIINSNENKIVVSAGPGSGKTYTIVRKIAKNLEEIEPYKGVIACSFTREASGQLKNKILELCDPKNSYIGTLDSFVLYEIINPFKNRFLREIKSEIVLENLNVRVPSRKSKSENVLIQWLKDSNQENIKSYCKEWLNNFKEGIYEISFPAYKCAEFMIKNMQVIKNYVKSRYEAIYIDEAQDLNDFQHSFLKTLVDECNLKIILIGDENQSIYRFRGAKPELFHTLSQKGYKEYLIDVSLRCHKSIIDYSNLIIHPDLVVKKNEDVHISIKNEFEVTDLDYIKKDENIMILCDTNDIAQETYEFLKTNPKKFIYTKSLDQFLTDTEFKENYLEIIEAIIRFYLNFANVDATLSYSIDDFKDELFKLNPKLNLPDQLIIPKFKDEKLEDYLFRIMKILNINIELNNKHELETNLSNEIIKNHYKNFKNANRILTIHVSKGLEANHIFVILKDFYWLNVEYKNKLFVAFTRAEDFLNIRFHKDSNINKDAWRYHNFVENFLCKNLKKISG